MTRAAYPKRGTWVFRNITRSVDFWPTLDSISIAEDEPEQVATFYCDVVDSDGTLVFVAEDKVRVTFDTVTVFAGHIKTCTETYLSETGPRVWRIEAQDFTAKADDSVIDRKRDRHKESLADRVAWIVSFLDYPHTANHLDLPSGDCEKTNYEGMTVREALDQLADEHRLHWYIDYAADVHISRDETVGHPFHINNVNPDYSTSYPCMEYERTGDSVDLATAIYVKGEKRHVWVVDDAAIALYGRQERSIDDSDIKTTAGLTKAGQRALAEDSTPAIEGKFVCWEPGLRGGMKVPLTIAEWGLSAWTAVLHSVTITAVDPNDEDGKAYLRCEVSFADRRKVRRGHRQHHARKAVNKTTRRRGGKPHCSIALVDFDITLLEQQQASVSYDAAFDFGTPGFAQVSNFRAENIVWPHTACGIGPGIWGPGMEVDELWLHYWCSSPPAGLSYLEVTLAPLVDLETPLVPWSPQDGVAVGWGTWEPTMLGDWDFVAQWPDVTQPMTIRVPGILVNGGSNYLVYSPRHSVLDAPSTWDDGQQPREQWVAASDAVCGNNMAYPYSGPRKGHEGNNGRLRLGDHPTFEAYSLVGKGWTPWHQPKGMGPVDGANRSFVLGDWDGTGIPRARWGMVELTHHDYRLDRDDLILRFDEAPKKKTVVAFRYTRTDAEDDLDESGEEPG